MQTQHEIYRILTLGGEICASPGTQRMICPDVCHLDGVGTGEATLKGGADCLRKTETSLGHFHIFIFIHDA